MVTALSDSLAILDALVYETDRIEQLVRLLIELINVLLHLRDIRADDPEEDVSAPEEIPRAQASNLAASLALRVSSLIFKLFFLNLLAFLSFIVYPFLGF